MLDAVDMIKSYTGARPMIHINKFTALIDTGADFNVWLGSDWLLNKIACRQITGSKVEVAGFTGHSTKAWLYTIDINIGRFYWKNVHILNPEIKPGKAFQQIILGASMFRRVNLDLDFVHRSVIINNYAKDYQCYDSVGKIMDNHGDVIYESYFPDSVMESVPATEFGTDSRK